MTKPKSNKKKTNKNQSKKDNETKDDSKTDQIPLTDDKQQLNQQDEIKSPSKVGRPRKKQKTTDQIDKTEALTVAKTTSSKFKPSHFRSLNNSNIYFAEYDNNWKLLDIKFFDNSTRSNVSISFNPASKPDKIADVLTNEEYFVVYDSKSRPIDIKIDDSDDIDNKDKKPAALPIKSPKTTARKTTTPKSPKSPPIQDKNVALSKQIVTTDLVDATTKVSFQSPLTQSQTTLTSQDNLTAPIVQSTLAQLQTISATSDNSTVQSSQTTLSLATSDATLVTSTKSIAQNLFPSHDQNKLMSLNQPFVPSMPTQQPSSNQLISNILPTTNSSFSSKNILFSQNLFSSNDQQKAMVTNQPNVKNPTNVLLASSFATDLKSQVDKTTQIATNPAPWSPKSPATTNLQLQPQVDETTQIATGLQWPKYQNPGLFTLPISPPSQKNPNVSSPVSSLKIRTKKQKYKDLDLNTDLDDYSQFSNNFKAIHEMVQTEKFANNKYTTLTPEEIFKINKFARTSIWRRAKFINDNQIHDELDLCFNELKIPHENRANKTYDISQLILANLNYRRSYSNKQMKELIIGKF
jgi:hypothetical protein